MHIEMDIEREAENSFVPVLAQCEPASTKITFSEPWANQWIGDPTRIYGEEWKKEKQHQQ